MKKHKSSPRPDFSRTAIEFAFSLTGVLLMAGAIPAVCSAQTAGDLTLQEVVVTAEKREETVQSTPISVTAVTGEQMAAQGVATVEELTALAPGISMRSAGPGQTEYEMRGLASSGGAAPTVGFYIDETPLSPAAAALNGRADIDPDLFDMNRVEVLRGPQGTLYGSGSMGGTIKMITNAPQLGKFEGAVEGILSGTDGGGFNRGGSAMVNIPFGDSVALRIVGTDKFTDGWIDRIVASPFPLPTSPGTCPPWVGYGCVRGDVLAAPVTNTYKDVNTELLTAARAILLVKPSSDLSFTTTGMFQRILAGGYNQYQLPPGPEPVLALYEPFNVPEPFFDYFSLLSEVITYDLSFAQFTLATSYWHRHADQNQDSTEALQNLDVLPAYLPASVTEYDTTSQFSQELRLTSTTEGKLQWVGGVFFSALHSLYNTYNQSPAYAQFSVGGAAANPEGIIYRGDIPYLLTQYALFADVSYKITPALKLTGGLRWYEFDTYERFTQSGLNTESGNATPFSGSIDQSARGFNPKVNLS
jgi:iron complex outermembrane recepter protein